jgi:serine/threonine protein kinase
VAATLEEPRRVGRFARAPGDDGRDLMYEPGDLIDIWVVESALGRGGMGSVYRCHNRAAKRILAAVKVLDGSLKRYPEAEARFIREADILGQLDHPNIVKVRNVRPDADPPYIEMEFAAGESLDERLRRGPVPYPVAVDLMAQCADAVAYLHRMGIFHRDIKPANLIVDQNRAKIVDFGLAVETDSSRITQQGVAFGTVSYAPPEWITPERLDPIRWDVYALGVVFWELLTGQVAFPVSGQGNARQQAMQVIVAKQGHDPLDPGDAFHDDVRQLIADMTRADPEERAVDTAALAARARALRPSMRRTHGVTLAPAFGSNPFADTAPPSAVSELTGRAPTQPPARRGRSPALSTSPMTSPPARTGAWLLAASMALGIGGLALTTAAVAAAAVWLAAPGWGPVGGRATVELDAPPSVTADEVDVVAAAGRLEERRGPIRVFADLPSGPVSVRWAAGEGCTVEGCSAGTCPTWCVTGVGQIEAGGTHRMPVVVEPREVAVALDRSGAADAPVLAALGGARGVIGEGAVRFDALPGRHTLRIAAGGCTEGAALADLGPPRREPGCTVIELELAVPVVGPPEPSAVALEVEEPAPEPAERPAPRPPAARRGAAVVTNGELAGFLADKPKWRPGGEYAGAEGYLAGWSGDGQPPAGQERRAPVGVTPMLALAFCKWRGSALLGVEAPLAGEDSVELRLKGDLPVYLQLDPEGRPAEAPLEHSQVIKRIQFRCGG